MSTLWWAGVAIDPQTQGDAAAQELDDQIDDMLAGLDAEPSTCIVESDGSEVYRYMFGSHTVSDIRDRLGNRIGFGIQCTGEEDGRAHVAQIQAIFVRWEVDALASVWTWGRMEPSHPTPKEVAFA